MINQKPRVRFAPSPTGYLHIGGLRTALYNYLFAKNTGGQFVLRIEDTDRNRFVEGATEQLIDVLKFIGLEDFEGPGNEGDFGPYIQSERLEIYHDHANQLIENGHAYRCFCSQERLLNLREEQQKQKLPQVKYDKHCLYLSDEVKKQKFESGESFVVRLNIRPGIKVIFNDIVRDRVEFDRDTIDDQVLIKSDGFPTYHLANVVDDHLMKITHVIRGEEWLTSTPKHVILYEAFGWELPKFAHLPLLLNPDKSKLSKRQGDVAVEDYLAKGYLKEALINFVALLGWSAGEQKDFYTLNELIQKFTLERVHKAGAVFNVEKLSWLNAEHIRAKSIDELLNYVKQELPNTKYKNGNYPDAYLKSAIESMKERLNFVTDIFEKSFYYFEPPTSYDEAIVAKRWKERSAELLLKLAEAFEMIDEPTKENFEFALHTVAEKNEVGNGQLIHPLRLAISGIGVGPGVYDIVLTIGKDETIRRIKSAVETIKFE
ncbi:MAG: glutamate--tRNA ligase [Melioribacteraceae bacterium]|nr:glutamate--tRNA ligase [Melioribacteraceae bacterium]MCF8265938.1 glutamate--tRNA ligase [Melioribacteraceae bacterium]MCF8413162.1 glutamate--tRNA ligase [Melioribacteraceae bacterium]